MSTHTGFPQYEQRPVNFGDDEAIYHDPYDAHTLSFDASSKMTHQTSGVPALDVSGLKNEDGQTQAELLASEYRSSPTSSRRSGPEDLSRKPSFSQNRKSAASNLDALTYIDEDFNYYSNRQRPVNDRSGDSLIYNAADMGREGSNRSIQDLGRYWSSCVAAECHDILPQYRIPGSPEA